MSCYIKCSCKTGLTGWWIRVVLMNQIYPGSFCYPVSCFYQRSLMDLAPCFSSPWLRYTKLYRTAHHFFCNYFSRWIIAQQSFMARIPAGLWIFSTLSLHESWKHGMSFLCWKSVDSALFVSAVNPSCPLSAPPVSVCGLRSLHREPVTRWYPLLGCWALLPAVCKGLLLFSLTLSNHTNGASDNSWTFLFLSDVFWH